MSRPLSAAALGCAFLIGAGAGYFAGREHAKHEIKNDSEAAAELAGAAFVRGMQQAVGEILSKTEHDAETPPPSGDLRSRIDAANEWLFRPLLDNKRPEAESPVEEATLRELGLSAPAASRVEAAERANRPQRD